MKKSELKYLLELIDDEQAEVREKVMEELANYGLALETDLQEYSELLDAHRKELLEPILEENKRTWFTQSWLELSTTKKEDEKIELGLSLIAAYQSGRECLSEITLMLNELAEEFFYAFPYGTEIDLAKFLFQRKKFSGNEKDYYNPLNSNLHNVLITKKGIPITLCLIYFLVAKRLGLFVEGCNFPGHFLAKTKHEGETVLVDCYSKGRVIFKSELEDLPDINFEAAWKIINTKATPEIILRRVLNNLVFAYSKKDEEKKAKFFEEILQIPL